MSTTSVTLPSSARTSSPFYAAPSIRAVSSATASKQTPSLKTRLTTPLSYLRDAARYITKSPNDVRNLFRFFALFGAWGEFFTQRKVRTFIAIKDAGSLVVGALAIPQALCDLKQVVQKVDGVRRNFFNSTKEGAHKLAGRIVSLTDLMGATASFVSSTAESLLFLEIVRVVPLSKTGSLAANSVMNGATILADGYTVVKQTARGGKACIEMKKTDAPSERQALKRELWLSRFKVAFNVCSVAFAVVCLVGGIFVAIAASIPFAIVALLSSSVYFLSGMVCECYSMYKERKDLERVGSAVLLAVSAPGRARSVPIKV